VRPTSSDARPEDGWIVGVTDARFRSGIRRQPGDEHGTEDAQESRDAD
jgi:hypothetical protein